MKKLLSTALVLSFFPISLGVTDRAIANPSPLVAQQTSAPQIESFSVEPIEDLTPGSELVFTLEGTPKAKVTMTIQNVARNIPMREVRAGYYEARYTIRSQDRITDDTTIRANLQKGNRGANALLQDPLVAGEGDGMSSSDRALTIDRFTVQNVEDLDPGTELVFTLNGTPKAKATYSIEGIAYDRPMREVASGRYEGRYVIRRQDAFIPSGIQATASLEEGQQVVRARLDRDLVPSNASNSTELPLEIISPNNNSQVGDTVEVRGKSAPNATVTINVTAKNDVLGVVGLNRSVASSTVQADGQGNFSYSFKPSNTVPGTRYEISFSASKGSQTNQETLILVQR
jgi:hypothetical protein